MGKFEAIKNAINANIKTNGRSAITGSILNGVLIGMVEEVDSVKQDVIADLEDIRRNAAEAIKDIPEEYVTDDELSQALNGKQDTISDLEQIREGAAKGANAIQKEDFISSEKVTAAALTDLDKRIKVVSSETEKINADIEALNSGKATKEELAAAIADFETANANIIAEMKSNEKVAAAALNDLNVKIADLAESVIGALNTEV